MISILKSKKGAPTDAFADMFFFFIYIIALLVFILLFSLAFGGCQTDYKPTNSAIIGDSNRGVADEMLLSNYLLTNSSEGKSFSELIANACLENNFDILRAQTKQLLESENPATLGILPKLRFASIDGPAYKGFRVELYVRCDLTKKAKVLIYKPQLSPGCPLNLDCGDPSKTLNVPLPVIGSADYVQLIMNSCSYLYPNNVMGSGQAEKIREECE